MTETDERYTPPELVSAVKGVLGRIDLDPCTTHATNVKNIQARHIYTRETNGLVMPWSGKVFLNAPGSLKFDFYKKFVSELPNLETSCVLEYNWDHSTRALQLLLDQSPNVVFLKKRYKFSGRDVGRSQALLFFNCAPVVSSDLGAVL